MVKETRAERKAREKEEANKLAQETLEHMRERHEQRKESVQETASTWTKDRVLNVLSIGIMIAGIGIGISSINNASTSKSEIQSRIDTLQEQITDLQNQINEIDDTPIETEYVIETLNNASELGKAVADGQNKYDEVTGYPTEDYTVKDHALYMDDFFTDSQDRVQWYHADYIDYEWEFETAYQFSGESIPVLWICYKTDTHDILAYATGIYNVAANQFSNVEYKDTKFGAEYRYASVEGTDGLVNENAPTTETTEETSEDASEASDESTEIAESTEVIEE